MVIDKVVLYIEDDPDDAVLFRRAVQREQIPCNLQIVSDVSAAMCYLSGKAPYNDRTRFPMPSLLVTDATVRGDGNTIQLITWVRSQPGFARLPVMCVTGNDNPDITHQFSGLDIHCLKKSSDMREAAQAVKSALAKH